MGKDKYPKSFIQFGNMGIGPYVDGTGDAANNLVNSAPKDSDFNPYDYIDQSLYRNNARGRMAYQEDLAKLLYMAQINQEERMNEYNSPEQQAQRMRAAGLNPDLLGVSGEAAANVAGYNGNPLEGTPTFGEQVSNVLGVISNVISIGTNVITGAFSFKSLQNQIDLSNLDIAGKTVDITTTLASMVDQTTKGEKFDTPSIEAAVKDSPYMLMNNRNRRRAKAMSCTVSNSPQVQEAFWQAMNNADKYKSESAQRRADPRFSDDYQEMIDCWKPTAQAMAKIMQNDLQNKMTKQGHEEAYLRKRSELGLPEMEAQEEADVISEERKVRSENDAVRTLNEQERGVRSNDLEMLSELKAPLQRTISLLSDKSSQGKEWATTMLISLYFGLKGVVTE